MQLNICQENSSFRIKEINQRNVWEGFLLGCEEKTFLDSWNWGEFNKMTGEKIWRLGIYENDNLISVALIIKVKAKRGSFLFLPHGPAFAKASAGKPNIKKEILKTLLGKLKKIGREERIYFIRIAPVWGRNEENIKIFRELGFREAPIHIHPEVTWELDITPSEEELLGNMRKTTRYLIRQGLKNPDLKIEQSLAEASASAGGQKNEDIENFNNLYQETIDRHHFVPFSLDYLKNEFRTFSPDNISLFFAKYKNEVLASAMIIFWQGMAFYHQGASASKHPKIPATYLLQWEAIREAKKRGCKIYNFWGIAPENVKNHPWQGLTLFKKGFGGYKKEYVKTQDLPLSNKYWFTFIFEKIRKIKRGL